MPPQTAAKWMMRVGFVFWSSCSIAGASLRSYSLLRGTLMSWQLFSRNFSTTNDPKNPAPPVTRTRWRDQNETDGSGMGRKARAKGLRVMYAQVIFLALNLESGLNHQADQLLKFVTRFSL